MSELVPNEVHRPSREALAIMESIEEALKGKWKPGPAPTGVWFKPSPELCYWFSQGKDENGTNVLVSAELQKKPDYTGLYISMEGDSSSAHIIFARKKGEEGARVSGSSIPAGQKFRFIELKKNTPETLEVAKDIGETFVKNAEFKKEKMPISDEDRKATLKLLNSLVSLLRGRWEVRNFINPGNQKELIEVNCWTILDPDKDTEIIISYYPGLPNEISELLLTCEASEYRGILRFNWITGKEGADLEVFDREINTYNGDSTEDTGLTVYKSFHKARYALKIVRSYIAN